MSRRRSSVAASIVAAALLLCLSGPAGSQGRESYKVEKVFVVNLPATQQVTGAAFVEGPARHAVLQRFKESVARAFEDEAQAQFPMEISAEASGFSRFASRLERFTIAFPHYRLLLYNTTDRTVSVNLFAYLVND